MSVSQRNLYAEYRAVRLWIYDCSLDIARLGEPSSYGMPIAESTNPTANPNKYTGKELLTDQGFNAYDYEARLYDPATGRWFSADEHSAKYPDISHYTMCGGDPINRIDPDGKDYFLFDQDGTLLDRVEIAEFDLVAMKIGEDGFEFGPIMEANTISLRETILANDFVTNESIKVDIMDIKGDDNVKAVHEFLADNGNVEFTRLDTGSTGGDNASNIISTSHQSGSENSYWYAANELHHAGINVRNMIHNHPGGSGPSTKDLEVKKDMVSLSKSFSNTNFLIYTKSETKGFSGKYYNYTNQKK